MRWIGDTGNLFTGIAYHPIPSPSNDLFCQKLAKVASVVG